MLLPIGISPLGISRRALTYLLRDEFTTAQAAPLGSPRTCEPGPGTLTLVQTDGSFGISSAKVDITGQATPADGDLILRNTASLARLAGRMVQGALKVSAGAQVFAGLGWYSVTTILTTDRDNGFHLTSTAIRATTLQATPGAVGAYVVGTEYVYSVVLRGTGAFFFVKGGAYAAQTLLWVAVNSSLTPLYAALGAYDASGTLDYLRVRDLPAPFTTDEGIATVNVTTPTTGTAQTATADAITDLTYTAPNPLSNSGALRYRVTDASNYWTAYFDSAGAFKADSVLAGVATNRVNVAAVATAAGVRTIRAIYEGSLNDFYTLNGTTWTKRGAQINVSHQNTATAINATFTDYVASNLKSYPRTSSLYSELDRT